MSNNTLTRRRFLETAGLSALALRFSFALESHPSFSRQPKELTLYVGTYTSGKSEGIYIYRLNVTNGELKHFKTVKHVVNPSYLAIDHKRQYLYAVNEVSEFSGKPSGALSAFSIDQKTGDLRFLNQQASLGGSPCYITVDKGDKFALVANYEGGNVSVLPIHRDGSLGVATDMEQHQGSSVKEHQEGPHAHCIVLDRSNHYAFAVDLGLDKIMVYRFDSRTGKLKNQSSVQVKPGAGPRHFTFHPDGRHAYVINELDSTVTAFTYDARRGDLQPTQTVATLPKDFSGKNDCADIHVSPSGRFLYGSNRGHDSIVSFSIKASTGRLTYLEHVPTQGKKPRNFTIDPTGTFLLAANQESDTVVTFRIDPRSGRLTPTGHVTEVPTPVCLKLVPRQ